MMYHAACKVEFQPFTRSYSQLTFFKKPGINMTQATTILVKNTTDVLNFTPSVNIKTILFSNIVPTLMRVI